MPPTERELALALALVNNMHAQLAMVARTTVQAWEDSRVTTDERWDLAFQMSLLTTTVLTTFRRLNTAGAHALLYVLEHGRWTLPDAGLPTADAQLRGGQILAGDDEEADHGPRD